MPQLRKPLIVGNTYRWRLRAKRDGVAWDLSTATVTLYLVDPRGNETAKSATITGGVAEVTNATGDLDEAGNWQYYWKIEDGSIIQKSEKFSFKVAA